MGRFKPGLGFGLERIGLAALRLPKAFTLLLLLVTAVAIWFLPNIRFEGDITAVLPEESEAYRSYFAHREDYRDFSRDITVVIRSDRLMTAQGLEDLRFLQLETAVSDVVNGVLTVFSAPDPDPVTGKVGNFFPEVIESDEQARRIVERVVREFPQASALIAPERNLAVMQVTLKSGFIDHDDTNYANYTILRREIAESKPDDFEVLYTGLTPIGVTIVDALVTDQLRLTAIGLVLGTGIAFYIFRSVLAALLCAIPPTLTAVWSLGLFGALDTPITYLSTVLPTLALILAFADGIVLYYRWQNSNAESSDFAGNLSEALRRVGPASSLTSVTTLLAFLSFSFAPGSALKTFSVIGMCVVAIAFLAVITSLPIAAHWAIRAGLVREGKVRRPAFQAIGRRFFAFTRARFVLMAAGALAAVLALSVVHGFVRAEYRITDYLPEHAEAREAETIANEEIGGRSLVFLSVPAAVRDEPLARANIDRLAEVEALVADVYPADRVFSLRMLAAGLRDDAALAGLADEFARSPAGRASYMSRDGSHLLVTVRIPSDQSITQTGAQIEQLRRRLDRLSYGKGIVVTGFDVLMAAEFTNLINQLRTSLLIAIFLGVGVIGIATRSPAMALVALTPNLLPVFSVELIVWLKGGAINISEVIALTIAFGIAVDNAVHVINVYRDELNSGTAPEEAIRRATIEVGPALAASGAIICVSALVTQASVLPMVPVLGGLMVATLVVAFFSNLAVLPANILTLQLFGRKFAGRRTEAPGAEKTADSRSGSTGQTKETDA